MTNSATARSRKRSPTRTYQSHTALRRRGVQETFQENGPTNVGSSSRRIQAVSGRYVATAHSKSIAMFSAFDPTSKNATTRLGSIFHTPTLGWSTVTVVATLSAPSLTADKAGKGAILIITCDHSLVQRMCHPCDSTRLPRAASASVRRMYLEANVRQQFFFCLCVTSSTRSSRIEQMRT